MTYIWHSAVVANRDFRLVGVDEDSWVTSGTTTTVAGNHAVMSPADGLLVDKLYGGVGLGLE